jgi:hypothetical protein
MEEKMNLITGLLEMNTAENAYKSHSNGLRNLARY